MLAIGLTGGIGSGKTTVAKLFAEHKAPIIDADLIARELVEPGQPALDKLVERFGNEILQADGSLDRRNLRERIFNNDEERRFLEELLHPMIRDGMIDRLDHVEGPYVVLVIPLLVDTGNWNMIDRILVVDVEDELQLERVMQRDGVSRQQAKSIVDTQISREDRLDAADDIIYNDGDITALREQVDLLHQQYMQEATGGAAATTQHHSEQNREEIIYEHPLNERIRTFLRLEQLFNHAHYHLENNSPTDGHSFISLLVDINNLVNRGDIKSEIIKELDRQQTVLKQHADQPDINQQLLNKLLKRQKHCIEIIHAMQGKLGQHLQADLLYNSVKQRLSIPGGCCEFDLPIFNYWLHSSDAERKQIMQQWLAPFSALHEAIKVSLGSIRESTIPETLVAKAGYYESNLEQRIEPQLIRVAMKNNSPLYPTISASKHRLNVRFLHWQQPQVTKAEQTQDDVPFALMVCGI